MQTDYRFVASFVQKLEKGLEQKFSKENPTFSHKRVQKLVKATQVLFRCQNETIRIGPELNVARFCGRLELNLDRFWNTGDLKALQQADQIATFLQDAERLNAGLRTPRPRRRRLRPYKPTRTNRISISHLTRFLSSNTHERTAF